VAAIDPALADTAAFCEAYDVAPETSANCVIVVGHRGGEARYAAVMVLATMRADVNGIIRRELDVRKCSFAPMHEAVALTEMEYGGITPVGLPED
jgi:prolyl-tRNA editing enzyme YbaK/EbsC (Cys-tRNA(Pro) deacylase)